MSIDGIVNWCDKREDDGVFSAYLSDSDGSAPAADGSPVTRLSPDLEEVGMHGDSFIRNMESTSSQLTPELRELAQFAAKCLYDRPAGRCSGVPYYVIEDRIATFGSERLRSFGKRSRNYHLLLTLHGCHSIDKTYTPSTVPKRAVGKDA